MSKTIVITGVSTGIGYGCAKVFLRKGYQVYGSVRTQQDADRLQEELGSQYAPLIFDVTDPVAITQATETVAHALEGKGLAGLINNAGIAIGGPMLHQPMEEIKQVFEVNVFGVIRVTQAFAPLLGAKKNPGHAPGKIIMIGSTSGKVAVPFVGAYAGSKHALEGVSTALRRELQLYGIDVVVVGLGAVKTPAWGKPGASQLNSAAGTDYEPSGKKVLKFYANKAERGLSPEEAGQEVLTIFEHPKPKTRYAPLNNKFKDWTLPRFLPDRMIDRKFADGLGLKPEEL